MNDTIKDDWTRQLAMMEAYDQSYSIFDHESFETTDPMAIIGMHAPENAYTNNRLDNLIRELVACRIPELLNTSIVDLLEFPLWRLEKYLKEGRKVRVAEDELSDQLEKALPNNQ